MNIKKSLILAGLLSAAMTTSYSTFAEEAAAPAAAEPAPPYTVTYNLGLFSNYMARGVNNSRGPAVQGGVDIAHSSGFYVGSWFSTTNHLNLGASGSVTNADAAGNPLGSGNNIETDWYGGYTHTFDNGLGFTINGNYVWYPEGEKSYHNNNQDTFEGSIAVNYKWITYTFYHAFTDWYGIGVTRPTGVATAASQSNDTSGAEYHEVKVAYTLPFADLNVTGKVGYQNSDDICLNQKDYALGINRNFSMPTVGGGKWDGFNAGLLYTNTFQEESCSKLNNYYTDDNGKDTNKAAMTFYIKRSW